MSSRLSIGRAALIAIVLTPFTIALLLARVVAGEDPGSVAKKTLTDLEATRAAPALSGAKRPPALDAAAHPIGEARKMLARASELRKQGDVKHAELAEDAALEWALAARELVRAVNTEQDAVDQAAAADATANKAARVRALLDEAIARRARLQKQFDTLEKEADERTMDAGPPKKKAP